MELENYLQMRAYGSGVLFDEDICRWIAIYNEGP